MKARKTNVPRLLTANYASIMATLENHTLPGDYRAMQRTCLDAAGGLIEAASLAFHLEGTGLPTNAPENVLNGIAVIVSLAIACGAEAEAREVSA